MTTLRVKLLAYRGAEQPIFDQGKAQFLNLVNAERVEFVENKPDLLFFLSGGSERPATDILDQGHFYTFLAGKAGNAYAAATEVKAYANQQGIRTMLLDSDDLRTPAHLTRLVDVLEGLQRLQGQKLGLIGEVSEWLIASRIAPQRLKDKLGIELKHIPWDSLPVYHSQPVSEELLDTFHSQTFDLHDTGRVHTLLQECITSRGLDAITVECFSLVTKHSVTACLPLGKFNAEGVPAGCEGDIVSIVGMMLAKETTGIIPWMANTVQVSETGSFFAHCTIAPNLTDDITITTHFETGKGTAIQSTFTADEVTLFRLDQTLSKSFLTTGRVLKRPRHDTMCRTQVELQLPPAAVRALQENPLGNHHLILPGDHTDTLALVFHILGLKNTMCPA